VLVRVELHLGSFTARLQVLRNGNGNDQGLEKLSDEEELKGVKLLTSEKRQIFEKCEKSI